MNHTLPTSLGGKYRLCQPVNETGGTNTSKTQELVIFFFFSGNHLITAFGGVSAHPAAVEQVCENYTGHSPGT